jgi:CubicO group peptidase (beta-lactamase class C family)
MASLERRVPYTHNTVALLPYSEGREFLTITAVLMEQEGILKLHDKVRMYFPDLAAWAEPITIEQLIHHHSGFADGTSAFS